MPAFVTAVILRFAQAGYFPDAPILQNISDSPTWFTHDLTLLILGVLSLLELLGDKSASARELLDKAMVWLRGGMALATTLGVLDATDAAEAQQMLEQADMVDTFFALSIAGGAVAVGWVRSDLLSMFREGDPDDDTALQKLWSWGEDLWAVFGTVLLILVPVMMLVLTLLVAAGLSLLRWRLERKEDAARLECPACSTLNYGCALQCHQCSQTFDTPRDVGLLGITAQRPAPNPSALPYKLVGKGRCARCATRFESHRTDEACRACSRVAFPDRAFAQAYLQRLQARLPGVLVLCGALSFIPVIGLIPAVIVYRVHLIAPLKRYLPWHRGLAVRWLVRLAFIGLVFVQFVPGLGTFAVPVMAMLSFAAYRTAFLRQIDDPAPASAEQAAAAPGALSPA